MKLKIFDIQNLAVAYVCLWATSPLLAFGTVYRLAAVAAVAVWALLEMSRPGGIFSRPTLPIVVAVCFIAYTAIIESMLGAEQDFSWHIQPWIMLFFLVFYESRRDNVRSMAPIFWMLIATLPIWYFTTIVAFDQYGTHTTRLLTRSSDEARLRASEGVGGYGLIYSIVVILPAIALLLLNSRRFLPLKEPEWLIPLSRIPLLFPALITANLVLGMMLVVRAGFSIAIILMIISVVLSLAFKRRSPLLLTLLPLFVVMAYLLAQVALVPLLQFLLPVTEGTPYYRKVLDVIETIESDQSQGTFNDRWVRYVRSFELFVQNPIFGVLSARDVGKHSAYLDTYARYGVLVGSVLVYLLTYLPVRMMRGMRDNFGLAFSVLAIMILLPLLNDVFASLGVMLFIMIPVACDLVERARNASPLPRRKGLRIRWTSRPDPVGPRPPRLTGSGGGRA
ncbi:MAG: hypothetical protein Q8S53_11785 [Brevundimonas sp.]|uniref:hypothetical protein n=1 Tax=Brevundimonas sp. TaxID=1871086 RepID=UPI0027376249|nr:hypothetical protein [Brevundimonas sp.]MDP3379038.1 hypothetical protein [Brevundimonas sp.]